VINDTLKSAMQKHEEEAKEVQPTEELTAIDSTPESRIATTEAEYEAYGIIKALLRGVLPSECISFKDTESYFGIVANNNVRKWICRLRLENGKKMFLFLPDDKYELDCLDDICKYTDKLIESAKRFV
jgi:hypothetical protein